MRGQSLTCRHTNR